MTLLCTYHHRQLHQGGFSIVRDEGGTLRFITADGRSIPRNGYRLEDFVDDDGGDDPGDADNGPSREGFPTAVRSDWERAEMREPSVYRLGRVAAGSMESRFTSSFS